MRQPEKPLWRKSLLNNLNLYDITNALSEIYENGDIHGYDSDQSGYY